ncbi:MAG: MBL fold metallo-hydrolase [Treponema sp.]|nr:MBL fold metallo-hydrolase [Treponema sp.]
MIIHFWGVRGSVPTPVTPQQVQSKIMAAIQRVKPSDLENAETRAKFVSSLPAWIFGTTGGNTSCVEITNNNTHIILDAGTGIRALGSERPCPDKYHLFFSHFHWDHIQGFPFFAHAFNPKVRFEVYSHFDDAPEYFWEQISQPYSPQDVGKLIARNIAFNRIYENQELLIDGIKINSQKMRHPGDSYAFSFEADGKKFVYATDVELKSTDYQNSANGAAVFQNADAIAIDSQYTVEEVYTKENWGHSSFCYAIDFAVYWNIRKVYLFHHEPAYDDKKLNSILEAARWYAQYINHSDIEIYLAKESLEIVL